MKVEALDGPALQELWPLLEDLRHDLGKYIAFETRFLGAEAPEEELRRALRSDLLATRRGSAGVESAAQIWARLRPEQLADDPDVRTVDGALTALGEADLEVALDGLRSLAGLAQQVRQATRSLHERARVRACALGLDPETL